MKMIVTKEITCCDNCLARGLVTFPNIEEFSVCRGITNGTMFKRIDNIYRIPEWCPKPKSITLKFK